MGFENSFAEDEFDYGDIFSQEDNTAIIKSWLEKYTYRRTPGDKQVKYEFQPDGSINVYSNCQIFSVKCLGMFRKELLSSLGYEPWRGNFPYYIKFNIVKGNFSCAGMGLKTLQGTPKKIYGHFDCSHNEIHNLKNGPIIVTGGYNCSSCKIRSMKGLAGEVETLRVEGNPIINMMLESYGMKASRKVTLSEQDF